MNVSKCKQKLAWLFLGKRLLLSEKYTLKCPRCGSKLNKINKEVSLTSNENSVVTLDICPTCLGMWLDDGEIEKLTLLSNKSNLNNKKVSKTDKILKNQNKIKDKKQL